MQKENTKLHTFVSYFFSFRILNNMISTKPFVLSIGVFILFPVVLSLSLISAQEKSKTSYKELLLAEIKRHPHSKVEDIYKFIHQASFGSEHAVKDTIAVRKWMENEISNLDLSINDEMFNQLSPDGKLVRINLRPYLNKGFDPNLLLDAFIKTANNFKGKANDFKMYWKAAEKLAKSNKFKFTSEELNAFFEEQSKNKLHAIHHSREYELEYKPAYRVIDSQYMQYIKNNTGKENE